MNRPDTDGWHVLQLGLSIGASAAAVVVAAWGAWKLARRWWNATIGRRQAQAEILDQLACGLSLAYVESLLGVPRLIHRPSSDRHLEERIYPLPGAWVSIHQR